MRMHGYEFEKASRMAPEFVRLNAYFSFSGYIVSIKEQKVLPLELELGFKDCNRW